jgi:hypothetical protein
LIDAVLAPVSCAVASSAAPSHRAALALQKRTCPNSDGLTVAVKVTAVPAVTLPEDRLRVVVVGVLPPAYACCDANKTSTSKIVVVSSFAFWVISEKRSRPRLLAENCRSSYREELRSDCDVYHMKDNIVAKAFQMRNQGWVRFRKRSYPKSPVMPVRIPSDW